MPTDLYQGMSEFYDTFVQFNRDYKAIAVELVNLFDNSTSILDVGIGTGLLVKQMIQLRPDLKIVGIDTSTSLLKQAERSLGNKVTLLCQDVSNLKLDTSFDVAYSRGGAWAFVQDGERMLLASHILEPDTIQRSFERIAAHLHDGGRLILTSSNANASKRENVSTDIAFERVVRKEWSDGAHYLILDYKHYQDEQLLGQQTVKMLLLEQKTVEDMLRFAGLVSVSSTADYHNRYHVYQKRVAK